MGKPFDSNDSQALIENIRKLALGGNIDFKDIQKAFDVMTSKGGVFFNASINASSKTFTGKPVHLADTINMALLPAGEAINTILKTWVDRSIPVIESIGGWVKENKDLAVALGGVGLSLTALGVGSVVLGKLISVGGELTRYSRTSMNRLAVIQSGGHKSRSPQWRNDTA